MYAIRSYYASVRLEKQQVDNDSNDHDSAADEKEQGVAVDLLDLGPLLEGEGEQVGEADHADVQRQQAAPFHVGGDRGDDGGATQKVIV